MERRRKKKMVAHLCLVQRIGEDECITSCRSQSRLLGRDGKRTVTVWYVGDNGFSSSQNRRVRVVYSDDDERLVRLCIVTKREKKKKGGGYHEQELVSCRRRTCIAGPHKSILGIGDLVMQFMSWRRGRVTRDTHPTKDWDHRER